VKEDTVNKDTPITYEIVGDIELPDAEVVDINARITQAEKDVSEARVHFRWGSKQVILIKQIAAKMGIPYQTYIKQALMRQAMEDLKNLNAIESHL